MCEGSEWTAWVNAPTNSTTLTYCSLSSFRAFIHFVLSLSNRKIRNNRNQLSFTVPIGSVRLTHFVHLVHYVCSLLIRSELSVSEGTETTWTKEGEQGWEKGWDTRNTGKWFVHSHPHFHLLFLGLFPLLTSLSWPLLLSHILLLICSTLPLMICGVLLLIICSEWNTERREGRTRTKNLNDKGN